GGDWWRLVLTAAAAAMAGWSGMMVVVLVMSAWVADGGDGVGSGGWWSLKVVAVVSGGRVWGRWGDEAAEEPLVAGVWVAGVGLKNPYLICDYCKGSYEAEECTQNSPAEQVCLSRGDIYDDPSLLRFYQNDDIPQWGNNKRKEKGEDGPKWVVRSKFEDKLVNFMLEKKFHAKGIREMLD
ncbi:hypothetical protein Tco_1423968, partial [Tanacetum coccineum]